MARSYNNSETGLVSFEDGGGHIVWNTDRPPVNLLPEADWLVLNNYQIEFPDFQKRFMYGYGRWDSATGNIQYDGCHTWVTLAPGEWGPGRQHHIPNLTLGTVPSGCNYVDVRVRLTRTTSPHGYLELPVPTLLSSQETVLQGGSCMVESCGGWRRMFDVVLDGSNVLLRRFQSTEIVTGQSWTNNYTANGFSHGGGSNSDVSGAAALIEQKAGGNANNERRRGGSDACSTDVNSRSFVSVYTGTIIVRPGYIRN